MPMADVSNAKLTIIGSGPTSVLCIGAYVDSIGGWDRIESDGIVVVGSNHHPLVNEPITNPQTPTHAPGMGRLGLYTTMMSNTSVAAFRDALNMFKSIEMIASDIIAKIIPVESEYDKRYSSMWDPDLNERSCRLYRIAVIFSEVFSRIIEGGKVKFYEGWVTDLSSSQGSKWKVRFLTVMKHEIEFESNLVFLATGIVPKMELPDDIKEVVLNSPGTVRNVHIEAAMDTDALRQEIKLKPQVLLCAYSHSSAVVAQALDTMIDDIDKVFVYHRNKIAYASKRSDGTIENDNTGLKQSAAFFTKMYVNPVNVERPFSKYVWVSSLDELKTTLANRDASKELLVVNGTGFERTNSSRSSPAISYNGKDISLGYNTSTAAIRCDNDNIELPNLFGFGSAFPAEVPASEFSRSQGRDYDRDIGLTKFSRYLTRVKAQFA